MDFLGMLIYFVFLLVGGSAGVHHHMKKKKLARQLAEKICPASPLTEPDRASGTTHHEDRKSKTKHHTAATLDDLKKSD